METEKIFQRLLQIPQFFAFSINNTKIWNYKANVVNTSANAMKNGCGCTFGKQLGGSTGINAMVWVCGNDRDYDLWASQGNPGWDYASVLPYMKKCENNTNSNMTAQYHGTSGPLTVSTSANADPYLPVLEAAYNQVGYKTVKDYNARTYNGFVSLQSTIKDGERMSSYRAFLAPNRNRPNLFFMKNSVVTKVLFSGTKATGVNVWSNISSCLNIKLTATREVILSAGTYGSTKIMLQSGLGKAADLAVGGVAQVKDLSVGYNLMDHVYAINFITVNPDAANQTTIDILLQCSEYFTIRKGPFTEIGTVNSNGFINTLDVNGTYPDIQHVHYRFPKSQEYLNTILSNFNLKDEFITALNTINAQFEIIMTFSTLLNPKSRGTIKLRSSDPLAPPSINTGYFTDPDDVATVLRGINKLQDLINTPAMQNTSAALVKFNITECNPLPYPSDDYWKCYIKYFTANLWHPSGTNKMGNSTATGAVVDANLKVHGIQNLRVADASIMPTIPSGNTQCPVYMIGEKAADIIKAANP